MDPAIASASGAIDMNNIEAEMLKGAKPEEDLEEKPVWDSFTAEEIKNESQKNFDNWGLTMDPSKSLQYEYINQPAHRYQEKYREENPFCHPSLNASEVERIWYYNDNQNVIQGPFNSIEMFDWFKNGYFVSGLLLRCKRHVSFITLRDFFTSINYRPNQRSTPEFNNPPEMYYDPNDPRMGGLSDQFQSFGLENPRQMYQPAQYRPMGGYVAPMHPAYFQGYPGPSYDQSNYMEDPPMHHGVRGEMQQELPAEGYPPEPGMYFGNQRSVYK